MQPSEDLRTHILVVDDAGLIAADIQKRLERLGYSVPAVASSGEEALRRAPSSPVDLVLMDIRLKGDRDGIAAAQALKAESGMPVYISAHADGETAGRPTLTEPVGYLLKPITGGDLGSAVQISLYQHDVERQLRASEAWLSATLQSVEEGILATNTNGQIVFLNPAAERMTGWSGSDACGRMLMDVLGLFEESKRQPGGNPVVDLQPGESRAYTLVSKAGARTAVELTCSENHSPSGPLGSTVVVRDISARREMEGRLIQCQRMEAVACMAGGLAHDFNNQLTVILGYAAELCGGLSGEERNNAIEIQRAVSIASSITCELLKLSRRDPARFEPLDLNQVVSEVESMIRHSLGRKRTLTMDLAPMAGWVCGDRNQFKQVLLNLALNARDAMPQGGHLRIESSPLEIRAASPEARHYPPGSYVRLRVSDTGEGMDKATLSRIFEPFFTTKKAGAGTGLGLAMVNTIVVRSGGYIRVESDMGSGTTFEILLPKIPGQES